MQKLFSLFLKFWSQTLKREAQVEGIKEAIQSVKNMKVALSERIQTDKANATAAMMALAAEVKKLDDAQTDLDGLGL
jgi:hypothetical protein